jgi:hypothetical protein
MDTGQKNSWVIKRQRVGLNWLSSSFKDLSMGKRLVAGAGSTQ